MARRLKALTLRIDLSQFRRLAAAAKSENRTPTNYVETLLLRDLEAKDESHRVITVLAAPEAANVEPGRLERSAGESAARYARRKKLVDELLAIPDEA
ncbi:MAG TPA: hypothetical protein VL993_00230 [Stellaceae bacterium]|nr:hypothetical protein [Stellaceae bacterium]